MELLLSAPIAKAKSILIVFQLQQSRFGSTALKESILYLDRNSSNSLIASKQMSAILGVIVTD